MEELLSTAQQFIVLYYGFIAKNSTQNIEKFYSPSAKVFGSAPEIDGQGKRRFPDLAGDNELNITNYAITPVTFNNTVNVTVSGNFTSNQATNSFTQCFTLKNADGATSIISDSLSFAPVDNVVQAAGELVEIPPFSKSYQRKPKYNKK